MARKFFGLLTASALVLQPMVTLAAGKPAAVAAAPKGPSAFVRCDGEPNKASTLGTVARLVAITAVIGLLLPQREGPDPKKRQLGADGIKACDEALTGVEPAKDGGRRIELIFGRSIHRMEAGDWDGAIADIHSAETDQPDLTRTLAYRQSLGLTAMSLEGMALVGKGKYAEAQQLGLRMADQAPYDLKNMILASTFQRIVGGYNTDKERFYAQLVRIYPLSLADRASQLAQAKRFAEAAQDCMTLSQLLESVPKVRGYAWQARAAIAYRLAGNGAEGDRLIEEAKIRADKDVAEGKSDSLAAAVGESADLYSILSALDAGQGLRARTQFSAHTRWTTMPSGFVAEIAHRLRTTGTAAEQANAPIPTADEVLKADYARVAAVLNDTGEDNSDRFDTYRTAFSPTEFNKFANNVWKTDKSKYIGDKPSDTFNAKLIDVSRNGAGIPGGYALLLHLALVAKAQGAEGFMIMPAQKYTYMTFFRMGKAKDTGLFAPVMFDPERVIADLGPIIPQPVAR